VRGSRFWRHFARRAVRLADPCAVRDFSGEMAATPRLTREFAMLKKSIIKTDIVVQPTAASILDVHFVMRGSPASPYEGGEYHGRLLFPPEYPMKPPSVFMLTPSGRFEVNTRESRERCARCARFPAAPTRARPFPPFSHSAGICFSFSDYHPESWNPVWTIESILVGLRSFMVENERTAGGTESDEAKKKKFAAQSHKSNGEDAAFVTLFVADFKFPE